jgi:flagellar hook assembly protein FlgD
MGAARQETAAVKGPQFRVSTDGINRAYALGEPASFEAKMTNTTNDTIVLDPFPPVVTITSSGEEKVVRTLPAGTNKVTALPGETVVFSVTWDQKDDSGNQVPAGGYIPVVSLMSGEQSIGSTQTGAVITIE